MFYYKDYFGYDGTTILYIYTYIKRNSFQAKYLPASLAVALLYNYSYNIGITAP